jgi:phage host-nuclease inhibitor protein Gam
MMPLVRRGVLLFAMADRTDLTARLRQLVEQRVALETRLQNEPGELSDATAREYETKYQSLQRQLASLFKEASEDQERITPCWR